MAETRIHFHQALGTLKELLIEMGGKTERVIDLAIGGYLSRDSTLCSEVLAIEKEINLVERRIDEFALELLASEQPMAGDLRLITACMKINSDLERVGDQAANIARRGLAEIGLPRVELPVDIPRIAAAAAGMIRRALNAFIEKDADLAYAVLKMDDIVDRMDNDAWKNLVRRMHEEPAVIEQALDALIVVRNLERVADHATNIAEDVIFWVRGTDVRHGFGSVASIEDER
jgi:phosphate transport system protein